MNPTHFGISAGLLRTVSNVAAVGSVVVAASAAIFSEPIVMGVAAGAASLAAIARINGRENEADASKERREQKNADKRARRLASSR